MGGGEKLIQDFNYKRGHVTLCMTAFLFKNNGANETQKSFTVLIIFPWGGGGGD